MTGYGTNLPIRNVPFHGESWRVSGRAHGDRESDVHDPEQTFRSIRHSAPGRMFKRLMFSARCCNISLRAKTRGERNLRERG